MPATRSGISAENWLPSFGKDLVDFGGVRSVVVMVVGIGEGEGDGEGFRLNDSIRLAPDVSLPIVEDGLSP